jgi:hypothetical protein
VHGPRWITGGSFGIEGSVLIAVVEIAAVVWLVSSKAEGRMQKAE